MVFGLGRKKNKERRDGSKQARHDNNRYEGRVATLQRQGGMSTLPPPPEHIKIGLGEIPKILARLDAVKADQTVTSIKNIRDMAEPTIKELVSMGRALEQDDLDTDSIDKHLAIIVVRGKKQVIDVIHRGVVPLPKIESVEDAIKAESTLGQILKKVGDVLGRQTRVIHIFAKKHANRFKENLTTLNSYRTEMRDILDDYQHTRSEFDTVLSNLKKLRDRCRDNDKRKRKISDLRAENDVMNDKILDFENEIAAIRSSDIYKRYQSLQSKIRELDIQRKQIRDEINAQFAKISRPLGRYEYGSALDKSQQRILANLVSNPGDALLPENREMIITILGNVLRGVKSGSIAVKDVSKTLVHLEETAAATESFTDRVSKCDERRRTTAAEADSAKSVRLEELEHSLAKTVATLRDHKSKIDELLVMVQETEKVIPTAIDMLRGQLLHHTRTRYEIVIRPQDIVD